MMEVRGVGNFYQMYIAWLFNLFEGKALLSI